VLRLAGTSTGSIRRELMTDDPVMLFLCGDVMLGRGVDQILPHPSDPALRERRIRDARTYVELAEAANGRIPRPVSYAWPWGDALALLDDAAPDVRVVNLENSITRCDRFTPGKGIHYRMNPANLPCLAVARPDACVLANNHVLDFGQRGLEDTLDVLAAAGLRAVGAGRSGAGAWRPAVIPLPDGGRVVVHAFGTASSGIPATWAAGERRAGVAFVPELSDAAADGGVDRVQQHAGDIVVASVHWGSNWGYRVSQEQVRFAHRLVEAGVDVVHGHSSHHPRPIEMYRDKLILYGCGDFIDDYEGIPGHEAYRPDLRLAYLASVEPGSGRLVELRMVPLRARQLRLCHASSDDAAWLRTVLDQISDVFGRGVDMGLDGTLVLR
jgi:poly-gamma-glutamate capsule biosynthesis protein CapA/YwtB (metallophosphatase superfamily)